MGRGEAGGPTTHPLTYSPVQQAIVGYWGSPVLYPGDEDLAEHGRRAQQETDRVLEKIGLEPRPSSVTVRAVTGLPAEALLEAAADADMLVVGSRRAGGFKRLLMGSVSTQVPPRPAPSWSSPTRTSDTRPERKATAMKSTIRDVMSTHVIAVRQNASYKDMAAMLREQGVSAFPVIDDHNKVIGVVSGVRSADQGGARGHRARDAPRA